MHEHSFIEAILSNVENRDNVLAITIEVGELAGIDTHHLIHHMEEHVDWKIDGVTKPAVVKCSCGYKGSPRIRERLHDMVIFDCPECGLIPEALEGKDIKIVKVLYK